MSTGSTSLINRSWITRFIQAYLLAFIGLSAVYFPTLIHTFGHSDDYIFFSFFRSGLWHPLVNEITAMGRPLNSLLLWAFLAHGDDLATLNILRGFGLATQALFSATVYSYLRSQNYSLEVSLSITSLWTFTPAMAVYAGWAIVTHYALGLAMAFIGGILFIQLASSEKVTWVSGKSLITAVFMFGAIGLYQPTFYAACLPMLLWFFRYCICSPRMVQKSFLTIFLRFFVYTSMVLLIYLLAFKVFSLFVDYEDPAVQRTKLNLLRLIDLPRDLPHLIQLTLKSWTIFYHPAAQFCILFFNVACFILLFIKRGWKIGVLSIIFLGVLYCWSLMPFYIVDTPEVPFRVLAVQLILSMAPLTGLLLSLNNYKITRWGASVIVVSSAAISGWLSYHGIVKPNVNEVQRYSFVLKEKFASYPETILFRFSFGLEENVMRTNREFGMHSMWLDWVPQYLLQILLNKQFGYPAIPTTIEDLEQVSVIRIYPWQQFTTRGLTLIDDYTVRFGKPAPPPETYDLDFWRQFGRSSIVLEDFGLVEQLNDGWIYHHEQGFIRIKSRRVEKRQ